MSIHPSAIIHPNATLGADVTVGPFAVIDEYVTIADGCRIGPHSHLTGHTTIGAGTRTHAGAIIGDEPQDLHYDGAVGYTDIGANCTIREYVTIHRGNEEGTHTVVGDGCMLMGFVHVAHNCRIEDHVIIANGTMLAGHVEVGTRAFLSGGVLVHQFCRIGSLAMIGGGNALGQDVPPFCLMQLGAVLGVNTVGIRRAGFDLATRKAIRDAVKIYFFGGLSRDGAVQKIHEELGDTPEIQAFIAFTQNTKRGILKGKRVVGHAFAGAEVTPVNGSEDGG